MALKLCLPPKLRRNPNSQYYAVAVVTLLFYDFFLTLRDEVYALYARVLPLLTDLSRCSMRGEGGSHGVCCPGSRRSTYSIESRQAFVLFILVRIVAPSHA